uniref:Transcription elongation factor n=1 Tax=Steinernema glaseri TaxID=37863 RepID=A0A1I7YHP2_9BILA
MFIADIMASCEEDVLKIAKKLEKMVEGKKPMDDVVELLECLSKLPINVDVLTKTRIGMIINDLRKKTDDEKVSKRAKGLIKEWKSLLDGKAANGKSSSAKSAAKPAPKAEKAEPTPLPPRPNNASTSYKRIQGDDMRTKWVNMIVNALRSGELPDGTLDPDDLAVQIEGALYELHNGNDKYKSALRSRIFNLRDKKNLALRENVLTGVVTPEKFARMTSEEMASAEMKEQREKFTKQAISEHQMAVNEGTPSDMFKCGKCGKKNCTYSQMQTRSADEPMTTFVYCRDCGNRWKFC